MVHDQSREPGNEGSGAPVRFRPRRAKLKHQWGERGSGVALVERGKVGGGLAVGVAARKLGAGEL